MRSELTTENPGDALELNDEWASSVVSEHERYIEQSLRSSFKNMLSSLPAERKNFIFYRLAELEKARKGPKDIFTEIILSTVEGIVSDTRAFTKALESLGESNHQVPAISGEIDTKSVLKSAEVLKRLGCSRGALDSWVKGSKLLAYKRGATNLYPAWQFQENTILPGLEEVLLALGCDGLEAVRMMTVPLELANGKRLVDLLVERDYSQAERIADQLSENYH